MEVVINNIAIELEDAPYCEFMLESGKPVLSKLDANKLIDLCKIDLDSDMFEFLYILSRWVHEAPRKRFYRNMIRDGVQVLSTEYFFIDDGGELILDALERTGKLAEKILRAYGRNPMSPIEHDGPDPIGIEELRPQKS